MTQLAIRRLASGGVITNYHCVIKKLAPEGFYAERLPAKGN